MRRFRTVVNLVLLALIGTLLAIDSSSATSPPAAAAPLSKSAGATAATPALQAAAGQFVQVPNATVVNAASVAAGGVVTATVTGANGIPAAAQVSAVVVQMSAIGVSAAGWVQTYAAGTTRPSDSTTSFVTGRYTATYDVVPVSASGQISVYSSAASTVYVRVRGYYTSASATAAGATFVPLPPTTVVNNVSLATNGTYTYTFAGANGIPATGNVAAVALSVVASAATAAGFLRTYPADAAAPADASVYYPVTVNQGNYETVKLSASGQVTFAATGATHLFVRLRGYYLVPTATTTGATYVPVARASVVNGVALAAGGTTTAALTGANGVPAAASVAAVAANVDASTPTAGGVITGYPAGATRPSDASVYYASGVSTQGHDTLGFSTAGQTTFYASGAAKLLVRLRGYYLKPTVPAAPATVTAVGADGSATVDWATPKDGGSPITGYTVTANLGAIKMTVGLVNGATIGGLTNGVPYTFTVQAINAIGTGPNSAPSKAIVPMGGEVLYAHDLDGRVKAAFTSDGTGVEYVYDEVGNITATTTLPANVLKIVQTGNPEVAVGDEYEIYGTGFGLDPTQVSVSVGGVNAPIQTLRRNHITVSIPAGSTSGAVTVTVGGVTAGAGSVAVLVAPQVTSFSPLVADRGATVTITGSNFAPSTAGNTVTVNAMKLQVLTATPTTLTVKAPTFGLAGKVSVRTKGGTASSSGHLAVVPTPFLAADVAGAPHTTIGTPSTITLTTSNQIALATTDGTSGKRFGYQVDTTISGCYEAHIWAPDRSAVYAQEELCGTQYIELPRTATTGTYLLELDPRDPATGSFTITAQESADVSKAITIDGASGSITTTVPVSHPVFTFTGSKGQLIFTTLGAASDAQVVDNAVLWGPSGQKLGESGQFVGNSSVNYLPTIALPEDGTYTLDFDPARFDVGTFTAQVTTVPPPITTTTTIDGAAGRLDITKPGQTGSVSFTGTAGQLVHVDFVSSAVTSGKVSVRAPDGSFLYRDLSWSAFLQYEADRYTLPQTGEYILLLVPGGTMTGSIDVKINSIPDDTVYPTVVDGPAKVVANTAPGQYARLTFLATDGQRVQVTCVRDAAHDIDVVYELHDPTGGYVARSFCDESHNGILFDARALTAGTWTVLVDPEGSLVWGPTLQVVTAPAGLVKPAARTKTTAKSAVAGEPSAPPVWPSRQDASLTGKILRTDGAPLANVTVRVADRSVKTRHDGSFVLDRLPQGTFLFVMDGRTASTRTTKYGYFDVQVNLRRGRNKLFYQPYLPILDTANEVPIASPTIAPVVIKTPKVKGLELHLPAGVSITDADGKPVTRVGITPIPVDRTPIPMPKGVQVPVYFTIQPAGGVIHGGKGQLYYPNYLKQKPGQELNFWTHEKYAEGWEVYGHGNVTSDGTQVKPSADTGIENFDGAMINVPDWLKALTKGVLEALGSAGDPIDLGTGRFTYTQSDLSLGGFIPIEAQRAYNSGDGRARPFGMGTMGTYDTFLTSDKQWEELDLNLIDGSQVHYVRTSPGDGWSDARFAATGTFGQFAGSTVAWNGSGWDLRLRDGTTLVYGDLAPLQSIRDRFGHSIKIRRIAKNEWGSQIGAIVSVTSSEGYWLAYDYNTAGQVTAIHDNSGRTVSYTYQNGLLKTVTDVNGGVTTYGWDTSNRLTTITDAKNQLFLTNTYDTNNRVIQQKLADGGLYKFDYTLDSTGKNVTKTTVTDPAGAVRTVEYDSSGYLTKDTSAVGTPAERSHTIERDPTSHIPMKSTDSDGHSMVSTYNTDLQATSTTVTLGGEQQQETATYNGPEGAMDSSTDALGNTTRYTFDAAGNVAVATDAEGRKIDYEWNKDGLLTKQTVEGAGSTTYEYQDDARTAVTDALGRRTTYDLDSVGRLVQTVNPDGGVSSVQYDAANQVLSSTDPMGATTVATYDKNGNQETLKDARGGTTTWTYDISDRVSQLTDQLGKSTTYTYTALGRPETVTDRRGITTEYQYDDLQRQAFIGYGRTGSPGAYQYQSTIASIYDDHGRLKSVDDSTPGAGAITYTYDNRDRLATETSAEGTITREWDDADRLKTLKVSGLPDTTYEYDKTDRLTQVTRGTVTASYGYDITGRLKTETLPGGVVRTAGYDPSGALTDLSFASGSQVLGTVTYHYDSAGRLDRTGGSWARADLPTPVSAAQFDPANRLTSLDGVSRQYDPEGHLLSDGSSTYIWNARGELVGTTGAAGATQIRYDALGRRIGSSVGADSWSLRYDGDNLLVEDGPGGQDATYLSALGIDSAVARVDGLDGTGGASALLTDGQGSVVARTTPGTASLAAEYTYGPYGSARSSLTADPNPVRYTRRESGPGLPAGLQFNRARWYEPATGRFLSEDPEGFDAAGPNLYPYVGGDPVDATDPSGGMPQIVAACVSGAIINTVAGALLGRKHTAGDYLRGLGKGCVEGALMFGVGEVLGIGLRSVKPLAKELDEAAESASRACPLSFAGETPVLMADGTKKPISQVEVGDMVLATDPATGEQGPHKVSALIEHPDDLVDLEVGDAAVTTTPDHPFWNATDQRFEPAAEFDAGDQVLSADGRRVGIGKLSSGRPHHAAAYNLTVDGLHTYYVLAGETPVLVHNSGGCIPWSSGSVSSASKSLADGATSVTVKSRSEAEELFFRTYQGDGYRNASGMDGVGTKQYYGTKRGTYHWDDQLGEDGRVLGHGAGNRDGDLPHLQVHTFDGPIVRIFWGP
ncbi:RHS repeat-associated core domain-containing protein [Kribbella sp. NPDC059898]|uniref:RHS repeat-associated core domain-containing protein n=1 Tax=Kribbella sp. NPDC059898 TaxID=3346995 RepID=UPI003663A376